MCIVCNPFCGHCRPPRKRAVKCPACGFDNRFDIVITYPTIQRACSACGEDVTALSLPTSVICKNTGWECANPCHWHTIDYNPATKRICRQNTPLPAAGTGATGATQKADDDMLRELSRKPAQPSPPAQPTQPTQPETSFVPSGFVPSLENRGLEKDGIDP
jgi:hypothetical protein